MSRPDETSLEVSNNAHTQLAFLKAINDQHRLAIRTAKALKDLVLLDTPHASKTELSDFKPGQVDPQVQLLLMARDMWVQSDDMKDKVACYRAMRDVFEGCDSKQTAVLELAMRERHHQEAMALKREEVEARNRKSMTEEELLAIAGDEAEGEK